MEDLTGLLVSVTLIEMMLTIGLGVQAADLRAAARDTRLLAGAMAANYVCVPAATVGLLAAFRPEPPVAAGFLILAACPGAPYGPPLTAIAKGDVAAATGLMTVLAASSTLIAPLLLSLLLPLHTDGGSPPIDTRGMVATLTVTQLAPLGLGLFVRHVRPDWANGAIKPAKVLGAALNFVVIGLILASYSRTLSEIRFHAVVGMAALLAASLTCGWGLAGSGSARRRAVSLTTGLRNVGLALVIAANAFPGTAAVTAVVAYGLLEVLGSLVMAYSWARFGSVCRVGPP